ncbi:hypothetical protein DXG03_000667 [Asterophora parasitica]|uniref:Uncharacterized protein n=1 Tax=Asterophora parasitica TaxID=117018 RepID=A0A9P7GAP5_9AGAR|nr:hypothetical protein DXG03_000667 [Asterophora parasitica]
MLVPIPFPLDRPYKALDAVQLEPVSKPKKPQTELFKGSKCIPYGLKEVTEKSKGLLEGTRELPTVVEDVVYRGGASSSGAASPRGERAPHRPQRGEETRPTTQPQSAATSPTFTPTTSSTVGELYRTGVQRRTNGH